MTIDLEDKIIITGCSGMLGYYTLKRGLLLGYRNIHVWIRKSSKTKKIKRLQAQYEFTIEVVDLLDGELISRHLSDAKCLIHCAAEIRQRPHLFMTSNTSVTTTLVNAGLQIPELYMVYVSSVAVLNRWTPYPTKEDDFLEEKELYSSYGYSKFLAEMEVWRAIAEGLNAVILNPSQIMGLSHLENPNTQLWFRILKLKRYYPQGRLGLVDVRDVSDALWKCVEIHLSDMRIIINGSHTSYEHFFNSFRRLCNVKPVAQPLPTWLHLYGAPLFRIFNWLRLRYRNPYNRKYLRQLKQDFEYDNTRSKELLNLSYLPLKDSLKDIATIIQSQSVDHDLDWHN